jgi:hypothetical protein
MVRKGVVFTLGLVAAATGALFLMPKKASASPLEGDSDGGGPIDEGKPVQPKNADEAYSLAMNPKMTDPAYVQTLATWLASYGQRPDWAAAAQKRVYDLKAELLLNEGLKMATSLPRVKELGDILVHTHGEYADPLYKRYAVQTGKMNALAPYQLTLLSGSGVLTIDLSIYSPAGGAVGPSQGPLPSASAASGGPSTAPQSINPAANALPPAAPSSMPSNASAAAASQGAAPLAVEETKPENDPKGTIALARVLLDEQTRKGWKYVSDPVRQWQQKVGLTADGKFGPGSALRMAQEVAIMPWVRYWPTGSASKSSAVNDYRGRLKSFALSIEKKDPTHALALYRAADQETGQGWPATPVAAPLKEITIAEVDTIKVKLNRDKSAGRVVS